MRIKLYVCLFCLSLLALPALAQRPELKNQPATGKSAIPGFEFRVLATNKTSTMEKEMNETAAAGFRFASVMGGETSFGGNEAVVVMSKKLEDAPANGRYQYKLLATNKTSTMQKEMGEAGNGGFTYVGQTVFNSTFGGQEVVVIMERDKEAGGITYDFLLLATKRTGTMQKEMVESGKEGYEVVGMTVAKTAFAGAELVVILRRPKTR
ncbi:MAG: hypothetical protein HYR56_14930 [Acidobacteria bacterium]|nr:hypothetical protein [Acidobacteriota bacterium]MBI3422807.1 hypothetical protein [Acidobacteriota bacterium]